jgi:hypothetical protein
MNVAAILKECARRGIRLSVDGERIIARPLSAVAPELREAASEHKAELIEALQASEALLLLDRLKTFSLPNGRLSAAREIAQRCGARLVRWEHGEPADEADDPSSILAVLRDIERELVALGGAPDPELAKTVETVKRSFPGSRLVDVRTLN